MTRSWFGKLCTGATLALALVACAPRYLTPGPAITAPAAVPGAILARDGTQLALTVWRAPETRAVLVALHGFNDYGNAFALPSPPFMDAGITIYAIDQRGFGDTPVNRRWPGSGAFVQDAADAIAVARAQNPGVPLYVMGESMGGAVALAWAAQAKDSEADGLILVAPAVWGWRALNPFYKATLWVAAHLAPSKSLTGRGLKIWPSDNIDMLRAYSADPRVIKKTRIDTLYGLVGLMDRGYDAARKVEMPTLVLYGKHDQIIPKAPLMRTVRRLNSDARLLYYEKGYHMLLRDLQGPTVAQDVIAWVYDRRAPAPSGAELALNRPDSRP